jgi:two-component system nitrogen regulation sensor histidine kinase GlnL
MLESFNRELSFHTDDKLRICSWGQGIEAYSGMPSSQAIGKKYYEILPRIIVDDKDAVAEVIKKNKSISFKGYPFNCLMGGIKADVQIIPVKSSGRNKVEMAQVLIQSYSACAAEIKLHQSQKLIDIGKIASTLAHGVRNPLNAIKGAVVYLREKYRNEEPLIEFTSIMEDEITRLELFITNFLSSSVSETEQDETDINSLLKKIEILTSLQIYTRNIHSQFDFGKVSPIIMNSFHLEQAILNVMNNAIEAMQGGGKLNIRTGTEVRSSGPFIVIAISDTGPGISSNNPDKIVPGCSRNGRGFGLSITREILEHYGGYMEIESKKNEGTTISLLIPCERADQKPI